MRSFSESQSIYRPVGLGWRLPEIRREAGLSEGAGCRATGTSLQHLDIPFHKPVLTHLASGNGNDPVSELELMLGADDFPIVHQQDQVADGKRRALVRIVERMAHRERVHGKGRGLLDGRPFESVRKIRLNASENGADRSADSGAGQPALCRQQMLMQVGDLLFRGQRYPHRFARYSSTSDR